MFSRVTLSVSSARWQESCRMKTCLGGKSLGVGAKSERLQSCRRQIDMTFTYMFTYILIYIFIDDESIAPD